MSRRSSGTAEAAAAAASEAARVLQARGQESKAAKEAPQEPAPEPQQKRDDGPPKQIRRGNPDREAAMEGIRQSRGEPKVEEPKEEPAAAPKAEAKVEDTPPVEEPKEEPKVEAAPVPETASAPEAPKKVRVKVDGEEFDELESVVEEHGGLKAYQITRAAEKRLAKANEALAAAQRISAEIQANKAPAKPTETDDQFITSKMDVLRFGTPEEAAKALDEIIARKAKPVDTQSIITQAQTQIDHMAAVRQFDKENADLVTNPIILQSIVAVRDAKIKQHQQQNPGAPIDWQNFYSTIAHEVRGAFGRHSQPASKPPAPGGTPSPAADKEARKASITNLPTAAARAELPKEEKPETREESLNRMRKARGQAPV